MPPADPLSELLAELEQIGDDEATIEIAAEAMAQGPHSRENLATLLDHRLPTVRRAATLAFGRRADAESRQLIEARLRDAHHSVRSAACQALAQVADERSLPALSRLLQDRIPTVRAAAAKAHRVFPSSDTVDRLDQLLRREDALPPRWAAVDTLTALGGSDELQLLVIVSLAQHIPREEDLGLRQQASEDLIRLAGKRGHAALLEPFRQVPRSGRAVLADALISAATPPTRGLARIAAELRHVPPDLELLGKFGSNLTRRAQLGELPRAHGREQELKAICDRLARPGSKSVVLMGPSGVGKTAIIHELARTLALEQVLVPQLILEATTGEILSGTRYLGEWQTRLKELQDAIKAPSRTLWYVPDVNRLVEAGTSEHSQESFAAMLSPAIERGEVIVVGESTPEAFRHGLDRHPGFRKLFWKLDVEVPTPQVSRAILGKVADELIDGALERNVELEVPAGTLDLTQDLANDYFPSMARPGNGVRLLRETVDAAVQEAEQAEDAGDEADTRRVVVTPKQVLVTLSRLTGVPIRLLDDSIRLDLSEVQAFFDQRVLGQEEAVQTVVDLISLIKAGLTDPERPLGVLFFAGPTGVGKTEMAKALAEYIFGSAERLVRVDLGEFREPGSFRRLLGDPHAPEPAARSGLLTAPVRERPFSVVLLDEVEKAHANVFDLLLPLMDEGRLVDELGRVTDFRRSIIVMTSNLGSDLSEGSDMGFARSDEEDDVEARALKVRRAMERTFRPEFLNRLKKTVVFASLSLEVMRRLTRREVRRVLARKGITRRNVIVETDDAVIGTLLEAGFSPHFGARYLKRRVEELLLQPLARAINSVGPDDGQAIIRLGAAEETLYSEVVLQSEASDEIEALPAVSTTARIKDKRRGRLVSLDDLEGRILELAEKVEAIDRVIDEQGLKQRKGELLNASLANDLWDDKARARGIFSEISALEKLIEAPRHLEKAIAGLDRLLGRCRRQAGESVALHELLARLDDLDHEIEFTTYAVHCPSAEDRGDAYLHLRRVGEGSFPEDIIAKMVGMYRSYLRGKRLGVRVVYEGLTRKGTVRVAGLRIDGRCAYGLLRGETGLHEWVRRHAEQKRQKQTAFVRVAVLPPSHLALRPQEITIERRTTRDVEGTLLKKHRQHLVVTHQGTQVALDGAVDAHPEAEDDAVAFLAARVARAKRAKQPEPGVVRRYALSHQPTARELATGVKLHLDQVLEGRLDEFVLPRVLG